jgi:thiamine pyrophosphate-dependent acetolactate synthase large subunit-like protein
MMHMADVLRAFAEHRGDAIVVPGRGGRYWAQISETALDLPLGDPAMGGHAGFALGIALAQPNRRVVLFDSEGDVLMSLGMLPTIAEQAPANFYHFVLDNECYATTGGQPVPNAKNVAYDLLARGAGYPQAYSFTELDAFRRALPGILAAKGPVLVAAKVQPEIENEPISRRVRWRKRTADQVVRELRASTSRE